MSEEEQVCKLIKCSFVVSGHAQAIVALQSTVPSVMTETKRLKLIEILTDTSQEIEAVLSS